MPNYEVLLSRLSQLTEDGKSIASAAKEYADTHTWIQRCEVFLEGLNPDFLKRFRNAGARVIYMGEPRSHMEKLKRQKEFQDSLTRRVDVLVALKEHLEFQASFEGVPTKGPSAIGFQGQKPSTGD